MLGCQPASGLKRWLLGIVGKPSNGRPVQAATKWSVVRRRHGLPPVWAVRSGSLARVTLGFG